MLRKSFYFLIMFSFFAQINAAANAEEVQESRIYSVNFYQKLQNCTPYSEKKLDGSEIKILGKNEDKCIILKTTSTNTQACVFKQEELNKLVEAGFSTTPPKRYFWERGKNIFNKSEEQTYWDFYKYKCKEIQPENGSN